MTKFLRSSVLYISLPAQLSATPDMSCSLKQLIKSLIPAVHIRLLLVFPIAVFSKLAILLWNYVELLLSILPSHVSLALLIQLYG